MATTSLVQTKSKKAGSTKKTKSKKKRLTKFKNHKRILVVHADLTINTAGGAHATLVACLKSALTGTDADFEALMPTFLEDWQDALGSVDTQLGTDYLKSHIETGAIRITRQHPWRFSLVSASATTVAAEIRLILDVISILNAGGASGSQILTVKNGLAAILKESPTPADEDKFKDAVGVLQKALKVAPNNTEYPLAADFLGAVFL